MGGLAADPAGPGYWLLPVSRPPPDAGLPPLATPSTRDPLRILEIGDSLGIDLGWQLQNDLDPTHIVQVTMDSMGDSGLSRPDYYNWPANFADDLAQIHPQIAVIFLGANDAQGFDVDGEAVEYGTTQWLTIYAQRVDLMLTEADDSATRVVWVGMPPMDAGPTYSAETQQIDQIYQTEVSKYPGSLYLSTDNVLGTDGGQFLSTGVVDGSLQELRTPDGIHLTPAGAELVSEAVVDAIDTRWKLDLAAALPQAAAITTTG